MTSQTSDFRLLGIVLGSVVCFVGTIGNLIAIVVYISNKKMQTAFNLLIVNLAMIDLITSSTIMPIILYGYITQSWPLSLTACEVFAFFYYSAHFTSTINLLMITLNRYMHVTRPHATYKIIYSVKRRRILTLIAWSISPLCLLPLLFTNGFSWWEAGYMCAYSRLEGFSNVYSLFLGVLFQLLPFLLMVVLYIFIFQTVKRSHANIDNPKIQVDECESYYSTETRTPGGNSVSPPSATFRSEPYKLRLGFDVSPSRSSNVFPRKFPIKTLSTDTLSPPTWRDRSREDELRRFHEDFNLPNTPRTNSNNQNDPKNDSSGTEFAVLRCQTAVVRKARLCRSVTTGSIYPTIASTNTNSNGSALVKQYSSLASKIRSVTFCSMDLVKHSKPPEVNDINEDYCSNNNLACVTRSGRENRVRPLQRPTTLNVRALSRPILNKDSSSLSKSPKWFSTENILRSPQASIRRFSISFGSKPSQTSSLKRRKSLHHAKTQRQLIYMSITICVAFAVCALPSVIMNLAATYEDIPPVFHMLGSNLGWLNAMINPIVYAAMNSQFQKAYSRLFRRFLSIFNCRSPLLPSRRC
nr:G-protein coupled receptor 84-like isoform X1 [Ciona intestinalis]|eukprot:XP_018668095.1 G-protein coupled receptor 84-like isoform X1 [Ciona intestinalis]